MRKLIVLLVALTVPSCKKHDKADPSPLPSVSVMEIHGDWFGSMATTVDPVTPIRLGLDQSGKDIRGVFEAGAIFGTVGGTIDGSEFDFTIYQHSPCEGTYRAGSDIKDKKMTGSFTGTSACLGTISGQFTITKE
jgi:hypothetical protein